MFSTFVLLQDFEQERYSLKNKIEMMSNLEQHYTEEVASLQEQLHALQSDSTESKQNEAELSKLRLKVSECFSLSWLSPDNTWQNCPS